MKYLILFSIFCFICSGPDLSAQSFDFAWAKRIGGNGPDEANSITTDAAGNLVIAGRFSGTVDFDPGTGVQQLTSFGGLDIFIVKLDPAGNFQWVKQMGGAGDDVANAIFIDPNGIIYTTGYFTNTADFDPGPAVFNVVANGSNVFVSKLTADGNFIWTKGMGGNTSNGIADTGLSIGVDPNGNVFTAGHFWTVNADFDPGAGSFLLSSAGNIDLFISKLDPNGNFLWAIRIGSIAGEEVKSLKVDQGGNVITTGLVGTPVVDFDPGPGVFNLTSLSAFILKLDPNGNFVWAKQFLAMPDPFGPGTWGYGIELDASANIHLTGYFQGQVDFDPGSGTFLLQSVTDGFRYYPEAFIAKLDPAGNFIWAKQMARSTASFNYGLGTAIDVDANGYVYTVGIFYETTDFDPGPGTYNLTATGFNDAFLSVLDASGNFVSARKIVGGNNADWSASVNAAIPGTVYICGNFRATADIDPCNSVLNIASLGQEDAFILKYTIPSVTINASTITICPGNPVTFTALPVNEGLSPVYQWQVNGVNTGTNSTTFTTTTLQNGDQVRAILTTNPTCTPPAGDTSDVIVISVTAAPAAAVSITSNNTAICQGTAVSFTATPTNGGANPSYQWLVNGNPVGTNSPVYSSTSLLQGDVVSVMMTSSISCVNNSPATSNAITMTVTSSVTPAVVISSTNPNICEGTSVTFTATPVNGGPGPVYQWKLNGNNTGTNAPVFAAVNLVNGDIVSVVMTSDANCLTTNSVISNTIPIVVATPVTPAVSVSASSSAFCPGSTVSFTVNPVNGGTSPVYQWQVNGFNVGANTPVFTTNSLVNADVISVIMTSNAACATIPVVTSNSIQAVVIGELVTPAITIASAPAVVCYGTEVNFTATVVSGGNSPGFQWRQNGIRVGSSSPFYTNSTFNNGDVISCVLTSSETCPSLASVESNNIVIAINANSCPQDIYFPTAFTPNRDGKNDVLKPVVRGRLIQYTFSVYNRWGQKVFESRDLQRGWDGKVKGIDISTEVFVWMCIYQFQGKSQEFSKGVVSVIR